MLIATATRMLCQHCQQRKANRPRGLCWRCYYQPGVAEMYPSGSKHARRGVVEFYGTAPLPEPTDTLPATPERLAVYERRAMNGEAIFHPKDRRITDDVDRKAAGSVVQAPPDDRDSGLADTEGEADSEGYR